MAGCIGSVVRSLSGRDKKRVFLVVDLCPDGTGRVLVADGKLHPLSRPKKKNLSHLAVLAAAEDTETSFSLRTDEEISAYLAEFESKLG